ncbi:MAG: adenylosuccinate synthetase [Nanoarchaeota archaeon]|nr:adenylosuccinate synthetase [Nanoarchaeota archaeon]MBU1704604.1 adenylosuccinate synthetase [Nanoarchaeota archaeon]
MGKTIVVVGGQWGDEGKGKVVDFLAEKADVIARATGGNNAGHTVVVGDKTYKFHLLPSGVIHPTKLSICGNGMVIDPKVIIKEITTLEQDNIAVSDKTLNISSTAHVITQEQIDEDLATGKKVGTTGRGIGPCYMAKFNRDGLRMSEFVQQESQEARKLKPFVKDSYLVINKAIEQGKNILVEGAQGTMLDIDHGTYPFVTSSNPTAGGACTGLGIGPTKISKVIAIVKAYTTRVGRGPFPTELGTDEQTTAEGTWDNIKQNFETELKDALKKANDGDQYYQGKAMRLIGREYGTTTGRARRTGWYDAIVTRYAVRVNGLTSIAITKLDVLTGLKTIKVCTGYEIDGKIVQDLPMHDLEKAKPVYEDMPGWEEDLTDVTSFEQLPDNAKDYVKRIEELATVPISILSIGPKRSQTIILDGKELF